ncbi:hypothetical protein JOC94_000355 [Bacillus thermophilus]|uniref:Uncharacterized protein n=1 Tax=Siminovitchia thermophila TaxID=1245522 RepID=A0ABS2R187_9BACI|nr:hypothetical protein [Siminovitchia thermophila]
MGVTQFDYGDYSSRLLRWFLILTIHPLPHAIGYLEYGLRSTSYDECKGS